METLSPKMDGSRGNAAAERVDQRIGETGGASGGRRRKARGWKKRFDGTQRILWFAEINERLEDRGSRNCDWSGEHK
jgi:hypothetical protein